MMNIKLIRRALAASLAAGALCFASTASDVTPTPEPATVAERAPTGPTTPTPFTAPRYFNPYTPPQDNPTNPPGTWEVYPSPTNKSLRAVDFVDRNNGWAAGAGVMLRYLNGSWIAESGHGNHDYDDIDMVSVNDGWAVGFDGVSEKWKIWRWNGSRWYEFQEVTGAIYCIDMINSSRGWIGGKNYFLRFNGTTWEWGGNAPSSMYDIQMESDNYGWAVGYNYIMRRASGSWLQVAFNRDWNLGRVFMFGTGFGWATGIYRPTEKAMILRYRGSWQLNKIFTDFWNIYNIWSFGNDTAWTCCARNYTPPYGGSFQYFDRGVWHEQTNPDPSKNVMISLYFFDEDNGWGFGSFGKIWRYKPNLSIERSSLGQIKAIYR